MNCSIENISYFLPENTLSNERLASEFKDWDPQKIYDKTGINRRHISAENETALDLAEKASKLLFEKGNITPDRIDFVLLATQSPDYFLPTSACILQNRLNIPMSAGALDFNLGCSAFVYGLALAKGLITASIAKNILLVTSETYSKYLHPLDKSVRTIFGDAAAAALITQSESSIIGEFDLGTDGSGGEHLIVPAGAARLSKSDETSLEETDENGNVRSKNNLFMNGAEIFNFTIKVIPKSVSRALEKNKLSAEDIDLFVFHQANAYMLEYLRKKCKLPESKFYVDLETTGNTVSSTIPIALKNAYQKGRLKRGDKVLLCGFGVGLSWGTTVIIF